MTISTCLSVKAHDEDSREMLHSSYNLTSTLASVIHQHSATPGEPLVLQVGQYVEHIYGLPTVINDMVFDVWVVYVYKFLVFHGWYIIEYHGFLSVYRFCRSLRTTRAYSTPQTTFTSS